MKVPGENGVLAKKKEGLFPLVGEKLLQRGRGGGGLPR